MRVDSIARFFTILNSNPSTTSASRAISECTCSVPGRCSENRVDTAHYRVDTKSHTDSAEGWRNPDSLEPTLRAIPDISLDPRGIARERQSLASPPQTILRRFRLCRPEANTLRGKGETVREPNQAQIRRSSGIQSAVRFPVWLANVRSSSRRLLSGKARPSREGRSPSRSD